MELLQSDTIKKLCDCINHPNLSKAEWAFFTLKEFWPWHREYTFLIPTFDINSEESRFISKLGFDIMKMFERELITREDYIAKYTDEQSYKVLLKYSEECLELQKNGNLDGLLNEVNRLRNHVIKNGTKTVLVDNICLAIVETIYLNPITELLHTIKYAPLEEAEEAFRTLKQYLSEQEKK